jgi:hypothetical protein
MHYFQEYFTIFVSLTIVPEAPFNIFLIIIIENVVEL